MDANSMEPFGNALRAYYGGDTGAQLVIRRDDGHATPIPVSHFFRGASQFSPLETAAIDRCAGRVLDIGAGTGLHSLALQHRDMVVTAIDVNPMSVHIMKERGVIDATCVDIFNYAGGPFDTMLLMGHGIGMVETLDGLDRFLTTALLLLAKGGQILLDSLDVRRTEDPANLAYHDSSRKAGRYVGEVRIRCEFQERSGDPCGWLQVDPDTLASHAASAGWQCEVLMQDESGNHLSRLTRV